jgi:hypothetical protein
MFQKQTAVVAALVASLALPVMAAVPADVTAGLAEAKADAIVIGGAVLVIIIAIAAFKWMRSAK